MAYVYKKFTAQDKAIIPFTAHKQYNFNSSSAASNRITFFTSSYTSESISLYTSASAPYGADTKNVVKYNQLDHLFYRDYIIKYNSKKDKNNFLKERRDLYEKANILSIPSGLCGEELYKKSFYISASAYELIDDTYGNLIISGTNINDYPNDVQQNVFRLYPIKAFKDYDLSVYRDPGYAVVVTGQSIPFPSNPQITHTATSKQFYRQGTNNPDAPSTYSTSRNKYYFGSASVATNFPLNYDNTKDFEDSYFRHELEYTDVNFSKSTLGSTNHKFSQIDFNSTNKSTILCDTKEQFNFNLNQNFSISFYVKPSFALGTPNTTDKRYIIAKHGTQTNYSENVPVGNAQPSSGSKKPFIGSFPFEIYMISQSLYFARSDGKTTDTINGEITASGTAARTSHILCQVSGSVGGSQKMQIYFDGTKIAESTSTLSKQTKNPAGLWIGSRGPEATFGNSESGNEKYFHGSISNLNIWSTHYNQTQINNISESINASPYVGNIFYKHGFATITHPKYTTDILSGSNSINTLQFQGSHLIYEHEFQCHVLEHEFNNTQNKTTLKRNEALNTDKIESFATSSFFKPYVTTIGLYNDGYELLAIAKLAQPTRMSDETDTTFVVRWDT